MKKLTMTVLAGAVCALSVAACSSDPASAASAQGGAPNQATAVYDWGVAANASPAQPAAKHPHGRRAKFGKTPKPIRVSGIQGTVTSVATSNSDSYALTSAGQVWAWGHGSQGELGNGSRTQRQPTAVRVDFPAGVKIASLPNPMPYDGGMAIDTTGTVWTWGNDRHHQFCQSGTRDILKPVKVPLPHVTAAAGALTHTIYYSGGSVYSCGAGVNGQLGNGTSGSSADTATPTRVTGLPSGPVKALTSAWGNAGVLMANGSYYDWGYNKAGQDGDSSHQLATRPVHVPLPGPASQVSQGGSLASNGQSMALLADGQLYVWGNGTQGELGDGKTISASAPQRLTEPAGVRFVKVNSGGSTDYAITSSGDLWAWGNNAKDQIGNGSTASMQTTPTDDHLAVTQVSSTASDVEAFRSSS